MTQLLLPYVANLEFEVDRLRKQGQFVRQQVSETLRNIHAASDRSPSGDDPARRLTEVVRAADELAAVMRDVPELPDHHATHDQVTAIELRGMVERIFRWVQRLEGAAGVTLRFETDRDEVGWFPVRLGHILENLLSNALRYSDPGKADSWVLVSLSTTADAYQFLILDNGVGLNLGESADIFDLFYRAGPARSSGLGVGLAVVKLLVEQSGGTLTVNSDKGEGTRVIVVLPRYEIADYLEKSDSPGPAASGGNP